MPDLVATAQVRRAFWPVTTRLVGAVLSIGALIYMTRAAGPATAGVVLAAVAQVQIGAALLRRGADGAALRFTAATNSPAQVLQLARARTRRTIPLAGAAFAALAGLHLSGVESAALTAALVLVVTLPVTVTAKVDIETIKGLGRPTQATVIETWISPLVLISVLYLTGDFTAFGLSAAHAAGFVASGAAARILVPATSGQKPRPVDAGLFHESSDEHFRNTIGAVLLTHLPLVVTGAAGAGPAAGQFAVAWRTTTISQTLLGSVNSVIGPVIATLWTHEEYKNARRVLRTWTHVLLFIGIAVLVALVLTAGSLSSLFGAPDAVRPIQLLGVAQLISLGTGPVGVFLLMTGHERHQRRATWAAVGVLATLLAALALVGTVTATGAAIAVVAAGVTKDGVSSISAWRVARTSHE